MEGRTRFSHSAKESEQPSLNPAFRHDLSYNQQASRHFYRSDTHVTIMYYLTAGFVSLLAMFGLAQADCQLKNSLDASKAKQETHAELCQPTGEGVFTFAMDTSEVSVPTFNGGNALAGVAGHVTYIIYDNTCTPRGAYGPSGNDCGTPYVIKENWLPYVLTVNKIDTSVGGPYFSFNYANGKYSINNNHCGCQDMSSGLEAEKGCKCAFPIHGEPN
jgi:hypothetical protein